MITAGGTLFTIPCEAIFNQHPGVYRSALVGVGPRGKQRPVIIVEPWPEHYPKSKADEEQLLDELRELGQATSAHGRHRDFFVMAACRSTFATTPRFSASNSPVWAAKRMGVECVAALTRPSPLPQPIFSG